MSPVLHADVSAAAAAADKHLLSSASKDILIQAHAIRIFSKKPRVHHQLRLGRRSVSVFIWIIRKNQSLMRRMDLMSGDNKHNPFLLDLFANRPQK